MDFGALPPEVNSGRMYWGPGPGTLLAASAGWEGLAAELHRRRFLPVRDHGPDRRIVDGPHVDVHAGRGDPVRGVAEGHRRPVRGGGDPGHRGGGAYETAFAMTVPPPMVAANRAQLMTLIATNIFGQNTPAIMATEAEYSEMWAQDATAMYSYAANSASASAFAVHLATTDHQSGGHCRSSRRGGRLPPRPVAMPRRRRRR